MKWLTDNISTIVVAVVLSAIIVLIILKLIKDRKNGQTSCGGDCSVCGKNSGCSRKPHDEYRISVNTDIETGEKKL